MKRVTRIYSFWQNRAKERIKDVEVTHRDVWQRWLEIETIKKFLTKKMRVLDVGCGNGYTTKTIVPFVREIVGIDYSEKMVVRAKNGLSQNTISFFVGDVLTLDPSQYGLFDTAVSERCLINLDSWESQKKAIEHIAGVLKPHGRFIFIEGLEDGRNNLNVLRKQVGLSGMPKVWHNIDFNRQVLIPYLKKYFIIEHALNFGVYDFVARVVHPLFVYPQEPQYDSKMNEIAASLAMQRQDFGDISRTIFLVLKKK